MSFSIYFWNIYGCTMDDDGSRVRGMMEASSLPDVWLSHYGSVCLSFLAASQHEKPEAQTNIKLLV